VLALETEDEIPDALEERVLEVGFVRELLPDLSERRTQLLLQLRVDRLGGSELVVKRLERLVEAGALGVRCRFVGGRARVLGDGLQSWRLRWA